MEERRGRARDGFLDEKGVRGDERADRGPRDRISQASARALGGHTTGAVPRRVRPSLLSSCRFRWRAPPTRPRPLSASVPREPLAAQRLLEREASLPPRTPWLMRAMEL